MRTLEPRLEKHINLLISRYPVLGEVKKSIVDAYLTLDQIAKDNTNPYMIVAPIGTKPHAIGAILYAIKHRDEVELLYDNPKRSVHRTDGIGKILSCNVTKLLNEN